MITKELRNAVLSSKQLEIAIIRFAEENKLDIWCSETECYMLGYLAAVTDIYESMDSYNQLILQVYEK